MKFLAFLLLIISTTSRAQQRTNVAPYKNDAGLPPIDLLQVDSTEFTKANVKKTQPAIIMYFSPTCDHCMHQVEDMIKQMDNLKNIQIIMATYEPFNEMVAFSKKYQLSKYPNIKVGRDTKYILPPHFRMKGLPYFALYDKGGKFLTIFDESNIKVDKLIKPFSTSNHQ